MCGVDDLDPGIKALPASLFEILLRLEHDLVDTRGDLELGCLIRSLTVAWGEKCHAATIGVGGAEERRGQWRATKKKGDFTAGKLG